jgi:two-component system chemotaxis response regulator CheB
MRKIRVLVVDDSVVVRQIVSKILADDPMIEVAGTAPNGHIALARIPQVKPDLISLDLEMPEMGGLETLDEIRRLYPRLPVVMLSTYTEFGARETLMALSRGAQDYVTKPSQLGSETKAAEHVRDGLIPKIKGLCHDLIGAPAFPPVAPQRKGPIPLPAGPERLSRVDVLLIGASTGGPQALTVLLPEIPADFPLPILIVQHMPPIFTRSLAERLTSISKIAVEEAVAGEIPRPGRAWLAPGDFHLVVKKDDASIRIGTNQDPPANSCRPSADVLFRSAAEAYGPGVLAVVLTGMGRDGLEGCRAIRAQGGQVLAQDQATSVVWGMPGFVTQAGLAQRVLPLDQIGAEVRRRADVGRGTISIPGEGVPKGAAP